MSSLFSISHVEKLPNVDVCHTKKTPPNSPLSSKTEREGALQNPARQKEERVPQNPARQREKEVFKIQQDRESEGEAGVVMGEAEADVKSKDITVHFSHN